MIRTAMRVGPKESIRRPQSLTFGAIENDHEKQVPEGSARRPESSTPFWNESYVRRLPSQTQRNKLLMISYTEKNSGSGPGTPEALNGPPQEFSAISVASVANLFPFGFRIFTCHFLSLWAIQFLCPFSFTSTPSIILAYFEKLTFPSKKRFGCGDSRAVTSAAKHFCSSFLWI